MCAIISSSNICRRRIVGTYRLQTGQNAAGMLGYYCAQEFEFRAFEPWRAEMIELGRRVFIPAPQPVVLGML